MTDSLKQLAIQLTRAIVPIIMIIGTIGNSLNIAVLTRRRLYHHACSHYFLALACNNLLFTGVILFYRLLADGYQHDLTKSSLVSCKLVTYVYQLSVILPAYLIVLASIDRFCISSTNVWLRRCSNVKVARLAILVVIIFFMLFYINTAVLVDLRTTDAFGCHIRADTVYKQAYPILQVLLLGVVAPFLMMLFGIMIIYNTKRVRAIPTTLSSHRRTENQLASMLLLQVSIYTVLIMPTCVTYLILVMPDTIQNTSGFYFARMMSQLLLYFSFATPFILYTISARTYRKELVQMLHRILRLRGSIGVHPTTNTITQTVVPMNTIPRKTLTTH